MENWPVFVLLTLAALLCRWQGDSWLVTITKLAALVVFALVAVTMLGGLWLRFS
jgi:hypothetical protein